MVTNHVFTLFIFIFIFITTNIYYSKADIDPNATGYKCTLNQTNYPCQTYALYRASSPNFLDLASIADLFQLSRLVISEPSNISSPSSPLHPNQPLLIPLSCSCNTLNQNESLSYANITYNINERDNFYVVSIYKFRNLTTRQSTELVNSHLVPRNLTIGVDPGFPIFCKCPDQNLIEKYKVKYLVTYVYQVADSLSSVAEFFGSSVEAIIDVNGHGFRPSDAIFVPVSKIPQLPQADVGISMQPEDGGGSKDDREGIVVGLSVALGVCGVLLILMIGRACCGRKSKQGGVKRDDEEKQESVLLRNNKAEMGLRQMEDGLMVDVSNCLDKYRVFKIDELRKATNGFDDESFLVDGSVYKGCIDGEIFAIKKMKWNACEELKILQKVNHGNLVRLEGFCIDPEDGSCYLVYEYVQRGSLHWWLHQSNIDKLSWKTRLKVAIDVANGLQYIHEHTRQRVVHKDITTSNILLDTNMRAKISKFGLAKLGCNAMTMHIVGTQGYIAPEYAADGMVSTKMDVFSFGVVLLELVSGKDAIDEHGKVLWASVNGICDGEEENKRKRLVAFMDEYLVDHEVSVSMASIASVINIAVACVHRDPMKRPSMVDIFYALCKSDDLFPDKSQDDSSSTKYYSFRY